MDFDVAADQAVLDAMWDADDLRILQDDRMLDLALFDRGMVIDRRERTDVGVHDSRVLADDRGAANHAVDPLSTCLDGHLTVDLRVPVDKAVDRMGQLLQHEPICIQHVHLLPGVDPPATMDVGIDAVLVLDEVLDRIGDFELAAPRRTNMLDRFPDMMVEHVDADQCEVGDELLGFLDQPLDLALAIQLRHPELARVGDFLEYDLRVPVARAELLDERRDSAFEAVIAEKHDETLVAQEITALLDGVGQAKRRALLNVGDVHAPAPTAAHRVFDLLRRIADDDADLGNAGVANGLDHPEEDRLVGHGNKLFGLGIGQRVKARTFTTAQDQTFHRHTTRLMVRLPRLHSIALARTALILTAPILACAADSFAGRRYVQNGCELL